jgi:hypothetical protein
MTTTETDARLLGPLELQHGQMPGPLGSPAQRALLARLLLDANRTVAVDRLVDDLPGAEEAVLDRARDRTLAGAAGA